MDFSHYTCEPVELAVELVNTDQRVFDKGDAISDLAGLDSFLQRHESLWMEDSQRPTQTDLAPVHALRDKLREIFEAHDTERAADVLNHLLAENGAVPRVSTHGGDAHLHFETSGTSFSRWLSVVTAMGLATAVVDQGIERFGVCAAEDCRDVFLDTSRNRSRRHCSSTCSTRGNVAAYRKRQKATR